MKKRYGNELDPLYSRWCSMIQRCENPLNCNWKNYGAKGIQISEDLRQFLDYKNFVESLPGYSPDKQLDRIDPKGNYTKTNLRWVERNIQIANQVQSGKGFNKYTGINWSVTHNRWIARVSFKGKCLFSKVCITEKEAYDERVQFILNNKLPHYIQPWLG